MFAVASSVLTVVGESVVDEVGSVVTPTAGLVVGTAVHGTDVG